MDSITQIGLGAAVGQATLGRRVGRKATVWGGVCGLLPDLDVLIRLADPVARFTYHRSFSHSLIVLTLLTPLVAYGITKIHRQHAHDRGRWLLLVFLAFVTHVILDCCTVYGTQIFWPIDPTPVTWATIFIIDPLYSVPLFAGVIASWIACKKPQRALRLNAIGLLLCTLYLAWGAGAKLHADGVARASLDRQGIDYERMITIPGPLNTILWRFVVIDDGGYYEGWYSLLDSADEIAFRHYGGRADLLEPLAGHWPVDRLRWFTKGFYGVTLEGGDVVMSDLRMGSSLGYVFRFKVGTAGNPRPDPHDAVQLPGEIDWKQLGWVWNRVRGN